MTKNFNTPDQNKNLKNNLGGKFGKKLLQIVLPISILVSSCVKEPAQPNIETIPNTINLKGTLPNVITLKGGDSTIIDLSATDLLGETLTPKISTSGNIVATVANGKLEIKSTDYNDSKGEVTLHYNSLEVKGVREEEKNKDFNGDGDKKDILNFSKKTLEKGIDISIEPNLEAIIDEALKQENGDIDPNKKFLLKNPRTGEMQEATLSQFLHYYHERASDGDSQPVLEVVADELNKLIPGNRFGFKLTTPGWTMNFVYLTVDGKMLPRGVIFSLQAIGWTHAPDSLTDGSDGARKGAIQGILLFFEKFTQKQRTAFANYLSKNPEAKRHDVWFLNLYLVIRNYLPDHL